MARNRRKFTHCPNCNFAFEKVNNYCPNCGQENHNLNVPVKHLMFSIHFHTFFFILTILALAVEFVFKGFDVDTWVFWIAVAYLFFALHQVYKQTYLSTFIKLIPIGVVYLFSLSVLFLGTLAFSVLIG